MTRAELLQLLQASPLVASVQASPGSPVEHPETLLRLAQASLDQGVRILRLEGVANIERIKGATRTPVIGLLKIDHVGFDVRITPTLGDVDQLIALGCEVIAFDGTARPRPDGSSISQIIHRIHQAGRLAMADCDTIENVRAALAAGADLVGTTLSGYTAESTIGLGPDLALVRAAALLAPGQVIAEGRYSEPWQAQAARNAGAVAVVIGGALNDPVKQTRVFSKAVTTYHEPVGAVDIGGTWLRYAVVSPDRQIQRLDRIALPAERDQRTAWIEEQIRISGVQRVGVGTGGVVDPRTNRVIKAKPLIPDHVGTEFRFANAQCFALNDGLATAWGHACLPPFAGQRVATLALGTGVGFGLVDRGALWMSVDGEPPHLNDSASIEGRTFEEILGGLALQGGADETLLERVCAEIEQRVQELFHPDHIVVCGGVGLSQRVKFRDAIPTPYGAEAGLMGAACLALCPPLG